MSKGNLPEYTLKMELSVGTSFDRWFRPMNSTRLLCLALMIAAFHQTAISQTKDPLALKERVNEASLIVVGKKAELK